MGGDGHEYVSLCSSESVSWAVVVHRMRGGYRSNGAATREWLGTIVVHRMRGMLMGGDGEAIEVEAPRRLVVGVARDNSCS